MFDMIYIIAMFIMKALFALAMIYVGLVVIVYALDFLRETTLEFAEFVQNLAIK